MRVLRIFLLICFASLTKLYAQDLVYPGDLIYHGAFRLPDDNEGGSRFGYGGTAPVYHPLNQSLYMVGHDWDQEVAEVTIPPLVISDDIGDLNTAEFLQPFRDISEGLMYTVDDGTIKVGGLLHYNGDLIGSVYTYYDADGDQSLSHFISDTNIVIDGDAEGMFQLGDIGAGYVSGFMSLLPDTWQDSFGGPALTGQCCIPIISRSSYGPAAFAFDPGDLGEDEPVEVTPLVYYPDDEPLAEWNSTGPYFNGTTSITGLVVPKGKRSVLFIGSHGIGAFCYGTGEDCDDPVISSQGTHAYPYVYQVWAYDVDDLLKVKNGIVEPWDVVPYDVWNFDFPISDENKQIGGAAYDAESGMIYISQLRMDGFDALPLIHAFSLRGPNIYVDSSKVTSGNGTSWTTAFNSLQDALAISHAGDTIHMAKGTYYPDYGSFQMDNSRSESFHVEDSVVILGGYPSGGGIRNSSFHQVVLSGDIDDNDVFVPAHNSAHLIGANAYNVMVCENAVLDGLIISGGMANDVSNPQFRSGAGLYCSGIVRLNECTIQGNIAFGNGSNGYGGGIYSSGEQLDLRNVIFFGNHASEKGRGIYTAAGTVVIKQNVRLQD